MTAALFNRRQQYLPTPTPEKLQGTLFDVSAPVEGVQWMDQEAHYPSYGCLQIGSTPTWPCGTPGGRKDFSGVEWIDGTRFAVYGGITCQSMGFDVSLAETSLRGTFERREHIGVERHLMVERFADAEDIHPGGSVKPVFGVAYIEAHAAGNYGGTPTLHISRGVAGLLFNQGYLEKDGSAYRTKQGSKVAAGGGYDFPNLGPDGHEAVDGSSWAYATGEVGIMRSELMVRSELDRNTNDYYVLGERIYTTTVDCYLAAVRLDIS